MKRLFALLLAAVMLFSAASAEVYLGQPPETGWTDDVLRIVAVPVGEGDAFLLECGGETMMVDGGPSAYYHHLTDALEKRGITGFKYLLNTHFHDDHINGLYHLMKNGFAAGEYLHPYTNAMVQENALERRTVEMARKQGIAVRRLYPGDAVPLGGAAVRVFRWWDDANDNARSMIQRVEFGSASAWLTADITGKAQAFYAADMSPELLRADILKAPHHGITPVQADFMDAVDPSLCVITNTRSNVTAIRTQLENRGIPVLFSGEGEVIMETNGHDWYVWQELLKKD